MTEYNTLVSFGGMVWYGMVWYGMVWYGMVWYGILEFNVPLDKYKYKFGLVECGLQIVQGR